MSKFYQQLLINILIITSFLINEAHLFPWFDTVSTEKTVVLYGGKVYVSGSWTNDAVAMQNGKITYIGDRSKLNIDKSNLEEVNVYGRIIIPGFVDNHNHIFEARSGAAAICTISEDLDVTNEADVLAELNKCKQTYITSFNLKSDLSDYSGWISGSGWNIEKFLATYTIGSNRSPKELLNEVFPNNPAVMMERSSHSVWVNWLAISSTPSLASYIFSNTDPVGGRIIRDSGNDEVGILYDSAGDAVLEQSWLSSNTDKTEEEKGLLAGLSEVAKYGITTVGDGRMYWKRNWMDTWNKVNNEGKLTARVSIRPWVYPFGETMNRQLQEFQNIKNQYTDINGKIIVNQVKMYSDGIVINQSAKTYLKYIKEFFSTGADNFGFNYIEEDDMKNWLDELNAIGYGAMIHVIGDKASTESLNAIKDARDKSSQQKYILTHCELVQQSDFPRFQTLDVSADFQAGNFVELTPEISDVHLYENEKYFGNRLEQNSLPVQSIKNAGANVIISSDWDVGQVNPLYNIANALDIGKFTSFEEALEAYTINPSKAMSLDSVTGSIATGKSADLVILNTFDVPSKDKTADMRKIEVYDTYFQGNLVYPTNPPSSLWRNIATIVQRLFSFLPFF